MAGKVHPFNCSSSNAVLYPIIAGNKCNCEKELVRQCIGPGPKISKVSDEMEQFSNVYHIRDREHSIEQMFGGTLYTLYISFELRAKKIKKEQSSKCKIIRLCLLQVDVSHSSSSRASPSSALGYFIFPQARSLQCDPFFPQIQDKKWEEERHQPWWLQTQNNRKNSPSDSTGHQDSGNGSIQTSSTLLLNSNRNYTSSLMSSASIISPYESAPHFHGTLNAGPPSHNPRCPQNNQESSTWRRLLTSLKEPGSRPKPSNHHLTLGNHHNHHLNAENTLRLATHRQLFQFNNVEFPAAHTADDQYDLHRSVATGQADNNLFDGLGGGHRSNESGLQYYASVIFHFFLATA